MPRHATAPSAGLGQSAVAALAVGAAAVAFYAPALLRARGNWPVPLDDTYIYFDFARSAALGHAFEWLPGNDYSSGSTSIIYPLLLAPAYLLGARGAALGAVAAAIAAVALVDLARSLQIVARVSARWALVIVSLLVVSVPLLDWSFFSGMETALFGAVLGRALRAASRAAHVEPASRSRAQWRFGAWGALLLATRPEAIALVVPLGVAVAHGSGTQRASGALARAWAPGLALSGAELLLNRGLTGEWAAAGAIRKLLWSNPYATPTEIAAELVRNIAVLRAQALDLALGGSPWSWLLPALALASVLDRRTRREGLALAVGVAGWILLVSFNATARFQNLRYAAPALAMLLAAAALGFAALVRRGAASRALGAVVAAAAIAGAARDFPRQIDHFARASQNIAEQHVEIARRLAVMNPPPRRVLVGDAGAIPFLSGLPALDGLGLGGYRGLPFARASVHGVAAVIELIERLGPEDRPDVMALYPTWWPDLVEHFGHPIDRVRIRDNVICAADEKVIYRADWIALEQAPEHPVGVLDRIDVGDLVDEAEHAYELPRPRAGWVVGRVLALEDGRPRFDAGRIVPEGRSESFVVGRGIARGAAILALRTDPGEPVSLVVGVAPRLRAAIETELEVPARAPDRWAIVRVALGDVGSGDRVTLSPRRGVWKTFTAWVVRDAAGSTAMVGSPPP